RPGGGQVVQLPAGQALRQEDGPAPPPPARLRVAEPQRDRVAQCRECRHLTVSSAISIRAATACAARKPLTAAGQPNISAWARAAARRYATGRSSTLSTPPAKSSPVTVTPAPPITSGSAPEPLTTTGVPQASASSAARPNVSTGPGASTTSAAPSSRRAVRRPPEWGVTKLASRTILIARSRPGVPPAPEGRAGAPAMACQVPRGSA